MKVLKGELENLSFLCERLLVTEWGGMEVNWPSRYRKWKCSDHKIHRFCIFRCRLRAAV